MSSSRRRPSAALSPPDSCRTPATGLPCRPSAAGILLPSRRPPAGRTAAGPTRCRCGAPPARRKAGTGRGATGPKGGRGVEARRRPGRGGEWRGAAGLAEAGAGRRRPGARQGMAGCDCARGGALGELRHGSRRCGAVRRRNPAGRGLGRWGRHAGVCSQAAAESGSSREMTEWGLPDTRARMGSLTSGVHQSVCIIMSVGFK
jgi:hypothetical protein